MKFQLNKENRKLLAAGITILGLVAAGFVLDVVLTSNSTYQEPAYRQTVGDQGSELVSADSVSSTARKKATTIYTSFTVSSVRDALSATELIAVKSGGIVENTNFNKQYGEAGSISVRIPEQNVSEFIVELEDRWTLESKNTNSQDVTDQYTELNLELKNKRQELGKLEELMNKTDKVEDLIKIQERMSMVRSRIQYLENRLSDLDRRTEYSRITVSFQEEEQFASQFEIRRTLTDAYRAIFDSLRLLIIGAGYILPVVVVYGIYKGFVRARERLRRP